MDGLVLAEATTLVYLIISLALSAIARELLKPKNKTPAITDKPTTLTTRGSHANYLLGTTRVGPFFGWAGPREIRKESVDAGGKGFGSTPTQNVIYQAGWHMLATNGPFDVLHEIIENGKTIFTGPITRDSHPSGATVELGSGEALQIYWGEIDQPVNTFLGQVAPEGVGVSSRWPFGFYVVWNKKRIGTSPNWPVLDYVVQKFTENTLLTQSDGYIPATDQLDGPTHNIFQHTNGIEGTGKFTFDSDVSTIFRASIPVELTGNSMTSGRYVVLRATPFEFEISPPDPPVGDWPGEPGVYETRTDVFLFGGVTGADDNGTLQAYSTNPDDGVNPAHAIADLLFMPWPNGLGLDPDGDEPWDLDSLEALGVEAETNRWATVWIGTDGEEAGALLGSGLQDLGTMVPIEYDAGKVRFARVRPAAGPLPHISEALQMGTVPEVETYHGESPADNLIFKFTDRGHDYGDMTIAIGDDGQANYSQTAHAKEVGISVTNVFDVAAEWAERRNMEEAGAGKVQMSAGRAARELIPGDQFTADGTVEVLLLTEVQLDMLDSDVVLDAVVDYYGQVASDFINRPGGGEVISTPPQNDLQFAGIEIPEVLLLGDPITVAVPRIRANDQVIGAQIHISPDNVTYTPIGLELGVQTGGTLDAILLSTSDTELATGPTITLLGPDAATALDLTGDLTNWRRGRQLVVIQSSAGTEIGYLKKLTALGGSSFRLDGFIRARYDTAQLTHPAGAEVYVFAQSAITGFNDLLLIPNSIMYFKSQPNTFAGQVSLATVPPEGVVIYGKGPRPMELTEVSTTAPFLGSAAYRTGDNISFQWGYRSANELTSGAGQQGAGVAVGVQTPRGSFAVTFLTLADVEEFAVGGLTTNAYTLTNADLIAAFGSEVSFKVSITQTDAGYRTPPIELTVTKI